MKLQDIEALMKMMSDNGVGELALDVEGKYAIELRMQGAVVAAHVPAVAPAPAVPVTAATPPAATGAPAAAPASNLEEISSPMVGTFYSAPKPGVPDFVKVGDKVSVGQTLCIVEAMKLMNEIESDVAGTIREILVENAGPVQFGQVLFRVEAD